MLTYDRAAEEAAGSEQPQQQQQQPAQQSLLTQLITTIIEAAGGTVQPRSVVERRLNCVCNVPYRRTLSAFFVMHQLSEHPAGYDRRFQYSARLSQFPSPPPSGGDSADGGGVVIGGAPAPHQQRR